MDIEPISNKRIYQNVIGQFVGLMRDGKLKVGDKCPSERTLAEMFRVSRASIREAFSAMEIIGLIEVRQGDGAFVTDLNIAPFLNTIAPLFVRNDAMEKDTLEFRSMLECEAVRRVAEAGLRDDVRLLDACLEDMARAVSDGNAAAGAEADIRYHKTLFAITGNFILQKSAECISYILESSVRFNRARILRDAENAGVLLEQHRRIRNAMAEGRADDAEREMRAHLDFVHRIG